jgi:Domain of unknown function (DUF4148)
MFTLITARLFQSHSKLSLGSASRIFSVAWEYPTPKRRLLIATAKHTQEFEMKKSAMVAISLVVLASSSAFAQGKTRAEVYQELIEAQRNGLNYITETSYPDVNPLFAAQVARMKEKYQTQQNAAKAPNTGMAESTAK